MKTPEEIFAKQEVIDFANAIGYNYNYLGDGKWEKKEFDDMPLIDVTIYTTELLFEEYQQSKQK